MRLKRKLDLYPPASSKGYEMYFTREKHSRCWEYMTRIIECPVELMLVESRN
jgi:hypothetical protein